MSEGPTNGNGGVFDKLTRFVRDVGFPIAVTAFLLYRLDPAIHELASTIDAMKSALVKMTWVLEEDHNSLERALEKDEGNRERERLRERARDNENDEAAKRQSLRPHWKPPWKTTP